MVEVVDVTDLDKYIKQAEDSNATDIVEAFKVLRQGSYNHYWAFNKGLTKIGVSEGCAILGDEYTKTEQEFPANN
jgi:beta-mannanase